ncbi:thioredoxin [candidate division WWE3 bacterium]|uniref:Thioredoxin n=1 Tax=candidate division WWE3 bacterium TaxID=2053526 RepID=A0A955RSE9_UNCKA|nr:thioredoxin [candidate division WWE3 bacterium]
MTVQVNETNFAQEVQQKDGLVLLDFWAPWCGPCRILGPIIEEIGDTVEGVTVGKVNVDENPVLSEQFGVRSIPTVILFKDGQPVEQVVGVRAKEVFLALIEKYKV